MRYNLRRNRRGICPRGSKGFTLVEVAAATAIIGLGIVAMMTSVESGTRVNASGQRMTQAAFLAQEIREWTVQLPFDTPKPALSDLANVTYTMPRNGQGNAITNMPGWSEAITITSRDPKSLKTVVTAGTSDVVYVEVSVRYQGNEILKTGWFVARSS